VPEFERRLSVFRNRCGIFAFCSSFVKIKILEFEEWRTRALKLGPARLNNQPETKKNGQEEV